MPQPIDTRRSRRVATQPPSKKCSGECGRVLPLSAFDTDSQRKDGRRDDCKECRRKRRGSRGKEGQKARALEKELWVLRETCGSFPSLTDILNRTLEEVRQLGAAGAGFDEQVEAVRRAVLIHGCRLVDEITEETKLSRWVVDNALKELLADKVVETRDSYRHADEAEESGRRPTEYHPTDTPRGELFSHILRRAVDDHLL